MTYKMVLPSCSTSPITTSPLGREATDIFVVYLQKSKLSFSTRVRMITLYLCHY